MPNLTTVATIQLPTTTHTPNVQTQPDSTARVLSLLTQPAQDKETPIPSYTKSDCEEAIEKIMGIINTHRNSPQWNHFAMPPMLRLLQRSISIAKREFELRTDDKHVSPDTAAQLYDLAIQMREMLSCPLSRQLMTNPVTDPLSETPFRFAFEAQHLAHFYNLQFTNETRNGILSTDLDLLSIEDDFEMPTQFEPNPLIADLCHWLRTYFPEENVLEVSETTAVAFSTLPPHLSVYSCNIMITGDIVSDIEIAEEQQQSTEQHQARMQVMRQTKTRVEESKAQAEKIVQEETERLMAKIKGLTDQCDARCNDLKKSNINTQERLAQEVTLRQALDKEINALKNLYWAKMGEANLAKEQLNDIQNKFAQLNTSHISTKSELEQTKTTLVNAQQSYNGSISSLYNSNYSLQQTISRLQSDVSYYSRRNSDLQDDVQRARNSDSGGWCSIS